MSDVKPLYIQPEDKSAEVIFKYYLPEHSDEVWIHTNANKMYSLLWELDQKMRSILKYEEAPKEGRADLAEEIRTMIWDEINFDQVR